MTFTPILALASVLAAGPTAPAPDPVKSAVARGLKWLAGQQNADGSWGAPQTGSRTYTTSYVGVALLMEGSTLTHGTYAPNLLKALAWLEKSPADNGRLGGIDATENNQQLLAHSGGLLLLACLYEVDDDEPRRARLAKRIDRALAFAAGTQSERGGWAPQPGAQNIDESYTTVLMLQALRAAEKAGFEKAKRPAERAVECLIAATCRNGRVAYRLQTVDMANEPNSGPQARAVEETATGAVLQMLSDRPRADVLARWVRATRAAAQPVPKDRITAPGPLCQQAFMGRLAYALGEDGHRRIDPGAKPGDLWRWSDYKAATFRPLIAAQQADGGWPVTEFDRTTNTAFLLIVLQLDNEYLPAFSR